MLDVSIIPAAWIGILKHKLDNFFAYLPLIEKFGVIS